MSTLLPIGEVARRSGVASSALRFYEQRGLISSERVGSGHRRYPRPVLRRIAFIVFAQRIGLTLEEIGAELDISARTVSTHLANIFDKTGVRDRAVLGDLAREHGLHR